MLRRLCLVTAAMLALAPATAAADGASSLTVVGTSDVSDSGLMQDVIQPAFQAAYPQFAFKYIGTGTGAAITSAESGSQGASVLLVHAPSLENRFVASGYSYERYGRAVFSGDFVLAGGAGDPAGVGRAAPHDIARAFAAVAAAGIAGRGEFVSRGGTPGTTVKEHAIWKLLDGAGLAPAGLLLCTVADAQGAGEAPIAPGHGVGASGQPCPDGGAPPSGPALPAWYSVTGLTQGPNVVAANACNGYPSGPGSCYVLTDRGTFDYLASGEDPAGGVSGLRILTRANAASAPGGPQALANLFHAYIVAPGRPGETVDLPAARDFLDLLTSPALQRRVSGYLARSPSGGAPFTGDAAPRLTVSLRPRVVPAGGRVTVTGTLVNAEPGYRPPAGQPVTVDELEAGLPVPVARGRTGAGGRFRLRFTPLASGLYQAVTPQLAQVEIPALHPPFGDLLSPAASAPVRVTVRGRRRARTAPGARDVK